MGALSILGKNVEEHRERLFNPHLSAPPFAPKAEDLLQVPPKCSMIPLDEEIRKYSSFMGIPMSRNSALAMAAFEEGFKQCGLNLRDLAEKRVAFIMGTTAGCSVTDINYITRY